MRAFGMTRALLSLKGFQVCRTPVAGLQVCAHCLLAFCRVCRFEAVSANLTRVCAHCRLLAFCRVCRFEELAAPSCLLLTFFHTTNAHSFVWTTSTGSGSNPALKGTDLPKRGRYPCFIPTSLLFRLRAVSLTNPKKDQRGLTLKGGAT